LDGNTANERTLASDHLSKQRLAPEVTRELRVLTERYDLALLTQARGTNDDGGSEDFVALGAENVGSAVLAPQFREVVRAREHIHLDGGISEVEDGGVKE
jgi:hypothetical protein